MKKILLMVAALMMCVASLYAQGEKRYGIKSGHIKYETQTGGGVQQNEMWFDDYGRLQKQIDRTDMGEFGMFYTETIIRDGKLYTNAWYNNEKKDEAKMTDGVPGFNYLTLTDQIKKDHKIEESGPETVSGKQCTVYSFTMKQLGRKVSFRQWVWKGIIIKQETKGILGANTTMTIKSFEENVSVPASTFALPKTIK